MKAVIICFTLLCGGSLVFLDQEELYVAGPLLFCLLIMAYTTYVLWQKDGEVPLFDIGFICILATFVYSAAPLLNFWQGGLKFGLLSDSRLISYNPTPEQIGIFYWRYVLYLAALSTSYLFFRRNIYIATGGVEHIRKSLINPLLILFVVINLFIILLELNYGFRFKASYSSEISRYNSAAFLSMPLLFRQISGRVYTVFIITKLAILFIVIQKSQAKGWRTILWIWIVYEVAIALLLKGARSEMMFFLMAAALMYHRLMKPFSLAFLVSAGLLILALFTFMGIYRGQTSLAATKFQISRTEGGLLASGGEFQGLLGTTYDVYRKIEKGGLQVPGYVYLNDFINILPPQQLLPLEKVPASEWYLRLTGLSGKGIGMMWGVITQCIVGLDWLELVLRGCLLGFILNKVHEWYVWRKGLFLSNIVYIYLCIKVYYTFRDTTGALLTIIVWEILPFCGFFYIVKALTQPSSPRGFQRLSS